MTDVKDTAAPAILNSEPVPEPEVLPFHRKKLLGWRGTVYIDKIQGWVSNRRIDLFRKDYVQKYDREPTNVEIYEYMRSNEKEYRLRSLAKDIGLNGVQKRVILAADGTLLDGNRRYFASRLAIEDRLGDKDELENIPAWVLTPYATASEKELVIVETNFLPSLKVPWPDYIKARVMFEEWENGTDFGDLATQFGVDRSRVRSMVKGFELVEEFIAFFNRDDDPSEQEEARIAAYKNFTQFEEAHNKIRGQLDSDTDFKENFFSWMKNERFKGIMQIRRLGDIRNDPEAWDAIRQDDPDAVKRALHIVDENQLGQPAGGEKKVKRVINTLKGLKEAEIAEISHDSMVELRKVLFDVTAMAQAVNVSRMGTAEALSTEELASVSKDH